MLNRNRFCRVSCSIGSRLRHNQNSQQSRYRYTVSLCTPWLTELSSYCHSYAPYLSAVVAHIFALRNHSFMTTTFFSNHVPAKALLLIHNLKQSCLRHSFLCRGAMSSLELSLYSACNDVEHYVVTKYESV